MAKVCPVCNKRKLVNKRVREEMFGVPLGTFPAEVCEACGESFLDSSTMAKIEARTKELGLWGLEEKVTLRKSGNSLVIRVPSKLAKHLGLKAGTDALIRPEGEGQLVIELA